MLREIEPQSETGKLLWLMKRYGVSFDIDGVMAATSHDSIKLYNERYGFEYKRIKTVGNLTDFNVMTGWLEEIRRDHPDALNDPLQEAIKIWNNQDNQRESSRESGALALMQLLVNHGIRPCIVTSRPSYTREVTEEWLQTQLLKVGRMVGDLHLQDGGEYDRDFKARQTRQLGVLFHFEDSIKHAEHVAAQGVIVGMVNQPWNENYVSDNHLIVRPGEQYQGRYEIIRTFLALRDFVSSKTDVVGQLTKSRNVAQY